MSEDQLNYVMKLVCARSWNEPLFDFDNTQSTMIVGRRGGGKSVTAEVGGEVAKRHGFLVFDLFDSGTLENIFWAIKGKDQSGGSGTGEGED